MVESYRRFSSLQNSFSVTVSHAAATKSDEVAKKMTEALPAGSFDHKAAKRDDLAEVH